MQNKFKEVKNIDKKIHYFYQNMMPVITVWNL